MLPQSDTERLLEERLQRLGVVGRAQHGGDGAQNQTRTASTATLRRADGGEETVHADWLAGCDGAHSIVRHALGEAFIEGKPSTAATGSWRTST